ncbi:MAG: SMC-Scp complex subunit ScpB [candidate division WOR-3 bacterium]
MEVKRIIEAILFISSKPVSIKKLEEVTGQKKEVIRKAIEELKEDYKEHSFQIIEVGGGFSLYTKPEYSVYIKEFSKDKKIKLSKPAMETLAIIAYKQPISKAEISRIKKCSPEWTIKILLEKGLIKPVGRLPIPGRPILYGTTQKFLEVFGLSSLDELPKIE